MAARTARHCARSCVDLLEQSVVPWGVAARAFGFFSEHLELCAWRCATEQVTGSKAREYCENWLLLRADRDEKKVGPRNGTSRATRGARDACLHSAERYQLAAGLAVDGCLDRNGDVGGRHGHVAYTHELVRASRDAGSS
jgi:hypothetical protein